MADYIANIGLYNIYADVLLYSGLISPDIPIPIIFGFPRAAAHSPLQGKGWGPGGHTRPPNCYLLQGVNGHLQGEWLTRSYERKKKMKQILTKD